jgi:hypothetical protein
VKNSNAEDSRLGRRRASRSVTWTKFSGERTKQNGCARTATYPHFEIKIMFFHESPPNSVYQSPAESGNFVSASLEFRPAPFQASDRLTVAEGRNEGAPITAYR